jgi:cephalosporin hydroxylase
LQFCGFQLPEGSFDRNVFRRGRVNPVKRAGRAVKHRIRGVYADNIAPRVHDSFFRDLVERTANFSHTTWLGDPIWQNVLDLWTIQEVIAQVKPDLLIECGTYKGGSSRFFGDLFELMGHGECITVDIEAHELRRHPRVTYLIGSTLDDEILRPIRERVSAAHGPVMVILDDDHSRAHVERELDIYSRFVTPNSYLLVQDGVIDTLKRFAAGRPGPLPAIESFLKRTDQFVVDEDLCGRFLITHHPKGWLRRIS